MDSHNGYFEEAKIFKNRVNKRVYLEDKAVLNFGEVDLYSGHAEIIDCVKNDISGKKDFDRNDINYKETII